MHSDRRQCDCALFIFDCPSTRVRDMTGEERVMAVAVLDRANDG